MKGVMSNGNINRYTDDPMDKQSSQALYAVTSSGWLLPYEYLAVS